MESTTNAPLTPENYETMHGVSNERQGGNCNGPQSVRPVVRKARNAAHTLGHGVPHGGSNAAAASSTSINTTTTATRVPISHSPVIRGGGTRRRGRE